MPGVRQKFLEGLKKIKSSIEEFKDEHKMASEAISTGIDMLPDPFNKIASIIWNGMEKNDEDSATQLLTILERIEASDEKSFEEVGSKLQMLLDNNASKKDIEALGERIRTSNQSVIDIINSQLSDILKTAKEIKKDTGEIKDGIGVLLESTKAGPKVSLTNLGIENKLDYTDTKELRFVLVNVGGNTAIVKSMRLAITDHHINKNLKSLQIAAPLEVYEYSVNLEPDVVQYEILSSRHTREHTSFYLKAGEADEFLIKLSSKKAFWYEFQIIVEWIDAASSVVNITESPKLRVEYSILL
jgi:hypothetical protein